MQANDENIKELVRKHLDGLNDSWQRIKEKVLSEQPFFLPLPLEDQSCEAEPDGEFKRLNDKSEIDYIPDDHLRYQVLFSDVFDWLVTCEENIRVQMPRSFDLSKIERVSARHMVR